MSSNKQAEYHTSRTYRSVLMKSAISVLETQSVCNQRQQKTCRGRTISGVRRSGDHFVSPSFFFMKSSNGESTNALPTKYPSIALPAPRAHTEELYRELCLVCMPTCGFLTGIHACRTHKVRPRTSKWRSLGLVPDIAP